MSENKNSQQTPVNNPAGQENKNKPATEKQPGNENAPKKTPANDDDQKTGARKEHDDKEHQHDYKTPVAENNREQSEKTKPENNSNPGTSKTPGPDTKTTHKGL